MSKKEDLVSIIIPVYNAGEYLDECLTSICNQTYKNLEVFAINDGSSDNSPEILDAWGKKDKRIHVIHKANSGVSETRNLGIEASTGKYIMFIDSDDYIEADTIETLVNCYKENVDLVVCSKKELYNGEFKEEKFKEHEIGTLSLEQFVVKGLNNCNPNFFNSPWNKLFLASVIKNENLRFNSKLNLGEDFMFNLDYLSHCKSIHVCSRAFYIYRILNTGLARKKRPLNYYWDNQIILNSHLNNFLKNLNLYNDNKKYVQHYLTSVARYNYYVVSNAGYEPKETIEEIKRITRIVNSYNFSLKNIINKSDLKMLLVTKLNLASFIYNHFKESEKKKIAIITINDDNNYGNRLQNYAVQKTLENYGFIAETVHNLESYKLVSFKVKIKEFIKTIIDKRKLSRYLNFKSFNKNINYSDTKITVYEIPKELNDKYNYFVVGSDQVWNPHFGRFNNIDLLTFVDPKKRVSFSASFGISKLPQECYKAAKEELEKFKAISVREDAGKKIIEDVVGRKDVEVLVDPTMMLLNSEWDSVAKKPHNMTSKKYILNYFLGEMSTEVKKSIDAFAKKHDCEIINLLDKNSKYYDCGPSEFVYLEKNAFLVCTDSFHSSVFAILYNVPFMVFDRVDKEENMGSRIDTLLSKFKLETRKFNGKLNDAVLKTDYKVVNELLNSEREKVKKFIQEAFK